MLGLGVDDTDTVAAPCVGEADSDPVVHAATRSAVSSAATRDAEGRFSKAAGGWPVSMPASSRMGWTWRGRGRGP